jgi:predicted CoA-binding protein
VVLRSNEAIAALLANTKTIALEIASAKVHRDCFAVLVFLLECGYRVIPVNAACAGQAIAGQ